MFFGFSFNINIIFLYFLLRRFEYFEFHVKPVLVRGDSHNQPRLITKMLYFVKFIQEIKAFILHRNAVFMLTWLIKPEKLECSEHF